MSLAGGNTQALGRTLYTQYLLPFEVISLVLTVGVIGAIVLALPERLGERGFRRGTISLGHPRGTDLALPAGPVKKPRLPGAGNVEVVPGGYGRRLILVRDPNEQPVDRPAVEWAATGTMGKIGVNHFLFLSAALFIIGMMGVLIRRNILIIFMCVELMVTAANMSLIAFGWELNSLNGQSFALFTIAVAAAEAAVGLAIIIALSRRARTAVDVDEFRTLRD
ncbi:MAG: hypothetical protein KatS3mg059_0357 [Thermomicrobiales bacterium]|nr:MAG: hypothetical protein KatS3mg059_0357 [Thermomicrobiales bacterium]